MYACFYCKHQLYVAILNKLIIILLKSYSDGNVPLAGNEKT